MTEQPKSPLGSRELLGIALFTLSAFPLILVVLALLSSDGAAGGGTAALARGIVAAVGYFPAILCAGGFASVGGAMLLSGKAKS